MSNMKKEQAELQIRMSSVASMTFHAAGVKPSNEDAEFFQEQEVTCLTCGAVFTASEADAADAMMTRAALCTMHRVEEPAPSHSIEERAMLAMLEAYGRTALLDLSPFFAADGVGDGNSYKLVKKTADALAASGHVEVSMHVPAVTRYVLKKMSAAKVLTEIEGVGGVVIKVEQTVYKKIPVPPTPELHVALTA